VQAATIPAPMLSSRFIPTRYVPLPGQKIGTLNYWGVS
jgi:hypothetical protein